MLSPFAEAFSGWLFWCRVVGGVVWNGCQNRHGWSPNPNLKWTDVQKIGKFLDFLLACRFLMLPKWYINAHITTCGNSGLVGTRGRCNRKRPIWGRNGTHRWISQRGSHLDYWLKFSARHNSGDREFSTSLSMCSREPCHFWNFVSETRTFAFTIPQPSETATEHSEVDRKSTRIRSRSHQAWIQNMTQTTPDRWCS